MLTGLNHLTLAVTDLERSFRFYVDILGAEPQARWARGAYLSIGPLWLCLSLDAARQSPSADYTHYAFSSDSFAEDAARLRSAGVVEWRRNISEGDSVYFLDPDGHQLELHDGNLASRLTACKLAPYDDMVFFGDGA
jgi:catechol 2,3-dioxygenase-like lactoylglutathione lyase family enzyme